MYDAQKTFWTSFKRLMYALCPGGNYFDERSPMNVIQVLLEKGASLLSVCFLEMV